MKKYLLMTTCLLAGLYALPAHAYLAPTPNVWEFYGVDATGALPTAGTAAMDGDTAIPDSTADTNLATKTYLDQPGGYGVNVTVFFKKITSFMPDTNSDLTVVSPGAGTYTLNSIYETNPVNNSILEHNRGVDEAPGGDGVGLGVQTIPASPPTAAGFIQSVLNIQGPDDEQEYFDEINFNELVQIDLGVDYAKYKDWYIQLSSMNQGVCDVNGSEFCFDDHNSAEIYTSASADPNVPLGTLLATIVSDDLTFLGSSLERYLYVNPKALLHDDCFIDELVDTSQCNWDVAFLVRQLSATPIPTETPEPGIIGLLGFALAGLGYAKSRRQG
ncbi:MAG: hypothetical protein KBE16_06555 [Alphaproteobacteria bacterium]|nr:hypothetical protein [Alphaproteobacteria bacterium]MBP9878170.1 hypothetical protein [Alphaproteobacteria bacterium]